MADMLRFTFHRHLVAIMLVIAIIAATSAIAAPQAGEYKTPLLALASTLTISLGVIPLLHALFLQSPAGQGYIHAAWLIVPIAAQKEFLDEIDSAALRRYSIPLARCEVCSIAVRLRLEHSARRIRRQDRGVANAQKQVSFIDLLRLE